MFNLGGNDKEKLKENMEEIKHLVESKENEAAEPQPPQPDTNPQEDLQPPTLRQNSETTADSDSSENTGEQLQAPEPQQSLDQQQNPSRTQNIQEGLNTQETSENVIDTSEEFKNDLKSISKEVRGLNRSKKKKSSKSKPVPSGDNTLFLEVDEFNHVQEMVEEMRYLSREVEDLMSQLERGVEDSRRFESEASEVLNEFSDRRQRIESSIN